MTSFLTEIQKGEKHGTQEQADGSVWEVMEYLRWMGLATMGTHWRRVCLLVALLSKVLLSSLVTIWGSLLSPQSHLPQKLEMPPQAIFLQLFCRAFVIHSGIRWLGCESPRRDDQDPWFLCPVLSNYRVSCSNFNNSLPSIWKPWEHRRAVLAGEMVRVEVKSPQRPCTAPGTPSPPCEMRPTAW